MPHLVVPRSSSRTRGSSAHAGALIEALESRLLMSGFGVIPAGLKTKSTRPVVNKPATSKPVKPPAKLSPPVLTGSTKIVSLTIGTATGKTAQPLGVNIGSMTAYAQCNVVNNMITQGGGFELASGRVLVHAVAGSTSNQLVIDADWVWGQLGYAASIGQTLVGSTGANMEKSWTITGMTPELDAGGNPTGHDIITIDGTFDAVPASADAFYIAYNGYAPQYLSEGTETSGAVTVSRDLTTAHSGSASVAMVFGTGAPSDNTGALTYYFGADGNAAQNVLQPGHTYQLSVWAKTSTAGSITLRISQSANWGSSTLTLIADGQWHQYTASVTAAAPIKYENGSAKITVNAANGQVNLDDVQLADLTDQIAPGNPLSKEVVTLAKDYGFGVLRYWEPELRFASLDQLIGSAGSRPMVLGPYSMYDPQLGLPEMLELCKETNSAFWFVVPTTWSAQEMHNLMEYLGGGTSTPYGAKRAADGHPGSWFADLKGVYLEAGNESWNGTFFPNSYTPFQPYFDRAENTFQAVKTDSLYAGNSAKIQLVANGWQWVPWFSEQTIANVPDADAIDVSAYTAGPNTSMPMTQIMGGVLSMQAADDATNYPSSIFGKKVYVYEEAPGVLGGSLTPDMESAYATSLEAGLATIHNAMTLTRDYGMQTQNLFTLFQNGDNINGGFVLGHYGIFADQMTALTNPRPVALAAQLLNRAQGSVLASSLTSGWVVDSTSPLTSATTTQAADAMVTFDGHNLVFTFFNDTVADTQNSTFHFTLPASINGIKLNPNWANATYKVLTGNSVLANNETTVNASIGSGQMTHSTSEVYAALPGHSMGSLMIPVA